MNAKLIQAVEVLQSLPQERQDELADVLTELAIPTIQYSDEEQVTVADGIADAEAGNITWL